MEYFRETKDHIQGDMDIDVIINQNSSANLISLGADDLITWKNLSNNDTINIELPEGLGFTKIAMHPQGKKFLLAGPCKKVIQYSLIEEKPLRTIYQSLGNIYDIKYSPSAKFISIASQQQKVVIINTETDSKIKCRPGHTSKVYNTFFSSKDKYVVSIGEDCYVLIYELSTLKDPHEVFKTKFTNQTVPKGIKGSVSDIKGGYRVFVPGTASLQIIEQLTTRWQMKKTNISHDQPILIAQTITQQLLVTSCSKNLCLWSIQKQQKLIWFPDVSMSKILPIPDSFVGIRNDGHIYFYDRPLRSQQTQDNNNNQQLNEQQQQSKIQFENNQGQIELQYKQGKQHQHQQLNQQQQQLQYRTKKQKKKRIADNVIKVYPQQPLSCSTSYFDQARFLYMNLYGLIIENRQMDETNISVQFNKQQNNYSQPKILFKNRQFKYFDIKGNIVCYANDNSYGIKIDNFTSWEKQWVDITGIAFSGEWIAVASLSEIRFLDITGNLIKQVCFDRPIIAMQAYENLLAVVYHESIPCYSSQVLAMRIFIANRYDVTYLPDSHVPLSSPQQLSKKASTLKWFGFSAQGMIFSQDSFGMVRAYSLQSNQWTPVIVQSLVDSKKAWITGIQKYQIKYWRTTQSDPQPTVRPRLLIKRSNLMFSTLQENTDDLQHLPHMLWQRYCLDHELARWRLWGHHKSSRSEKHINYQQSKSILTEKAVHQQHLSLDLNFYKIIKCYLKNQQIGRAVSCVKSHVRTIEAGKNLVDYFDDCGFRSEAVELEYFYDQKQKQIEYQAMQQLLLKQLKSKVETTIKAKKQNPMNPKFRKQMKDSIPYHISSQPSQNSSIVMEDITHKAQQNAKQEQQIENPFLKKKPTIDRKQEIEQHLQKYAVKKKVQDKKKGNKM